MPLRQRSTVQMAIGIRDGSVSRVALIKMPLRQPSTATAHMAIASATARCHALLWLRSRCATADSYRAMWHQGVLMRIDFPHGPSETIAPISPINSW